MASLREKIYNGNYDRAIKDFNQAIRLDREYSLAYVNRGSAYYLKNDYDRAISDYTQAIRLDPNYTIAYYNRGSAYFSKRDYDQAIKDYETVLRLEPNHADAKKQLDAVRQARGR